jgi:hypothetical protein
MPIEKDVYEKESYWCPKWYWPFAVCSRTVRKHKWCYQFAWVKETGYGVVSYLEGCENGTLYTWYAGSFAVFGGHTYPGGEMCFDSPRDSSGVCDPSRTGLLGSPLVEGESESDPWFLRIEPKSPPAYERSVEATVLADDAVHSQWLHCQLYKVREWEVGAVAHIVGGMPTPPVIFNWTLAGKAVPAVQTGDTMSTLTLKSPPLAASATLSVTAADASGFSRTLSVNVDLTSTKVSCHLVLHFVPPMYELPPGPPGPVEITAEMDRLLQRIRTVVDERPAVNLTSKRTE